MYDEEYQRKKAFWRLTFWTFTFIAALTGINILFIMNSVSIGFFRTEDRSPASVQEDSATKVKIPIPTVVEIHCNKKGPIQTQTQASSTRFLFKNCVRVDSLINETNNGHADLFPLPGKQWTSDFILLKVGENRITAQSGDSIQIVNIIRENPKNEGDDKAL